MLTCYSSIVEQKNMLLNYRWAHTIGLFCLFIASLLSLYCVSFVSLLRLFCLFMIESLLSLYCVSFDDIAYLSLEEVVDEGGDKEGQENEVAQQVEDDEVKLPEKKTVSTLNGESTK